VRDRDYLFAGNAISEVKAKIHNQIVDHYNWMDEALINALNDGKDPMAVTRLWGRNIRALGEMAGELLPDRPWHAAKMRELTGNAKKVLRWKASALNFNPDSPNLDLALSGMTPWNDGEKWMLAVALPAPEPFSFAREHGGPDGIILIDPKTGEASVLGDSNPALILPIETDHLTVHTDARLWARDFATARVEWLFGKFNAERVANITPKWTGMPPAALLIGDPIKVAWPRGANITVGEGVDAKAIQKAIYAQSRTSRVHQSQKIKRVA